jgi:hypothetical protein
VDRVTRLGQRGMHAAVEPVGGAGQVGRAELVDDRPDSWVA